MEITRRWCGYVCPDCRFIFRVPNDHDGLGIVCPSCRRMLKIPSAADITPPLMAPLRKVEEEQFSPEEMAEIHQTTIAAQRNSPWLLIGGGILTLGLFAVGTAVFMTGKRADVPAPVPAPITVAQEPIAPDSINLSERSEASLALDLKPLAGKFLEATTVSQCLPLVRNPNVAEARIRELHPGGRIEPLGMSEFNADGQMAIQDQWVSLTVRTRDQEAKSMVFVKTPDGFKIDWESWTGWSEMPWENYLETKPTVPLLFRVSVFQTEYYNFAFSDDLKWQSYRLESPNGEHSVYAYVEKGSDLARQIQLDRDAKQVPMILRLKFPEGAASNGQVEIDQFITNGWVEKESK
jgi:hypothetical protein